MRLMRLVVLALVGLSCGGGTRTATTTTTAPAAAKLPCADDAACDRLEDAAFLEVHTYLDDEAVLRAAVPVLQARCDAGVMRSCQRLGILHRHGAGGLARDRDRSFVLFKRACDGG